MKLFELGVSKPSKQAAKVFESYFGDSINVDAISPKQAQMMLGKIRKLVNEHKATAAYHKSEQNPTYLKLMMMERVLATKVKEGGETVGLASPAGADFNTSMAKQKASGVNLAVAASSQTDQEQQQQQKMDAQKQSAGVKPSVGATTTDLQTATNALATGKATPVQKAMVAKAAQMNESYRRKIYHLLRESEVQQAQVVLAAQDMVDEVQSMLEKVTSIQFKDLPALVDQIKNQVGVDQAMQFNTDATAALAGLVQNLQQSKQQMDAALGTVTGQGAPAVPGMDQTTPRYSNRFDVQQDPDREDRQTERTVRRISPPAVSRVDQRAARRRFRERLDAAWTRIRSRSAGRV